MRKNRLADAIGYALSGDLLIPGWDEQAVAELARWCEWAPA